MALVTLQRSPTPSAASSAGTATTAAGKDFGSEDERQANQSLSESFFMVRGAALFLQQGSPHPSQKSHPHYKHAGDLPQHLQVMINILRSEDRIKLAVRLESAWSDRVRYMVVVYTSGRQDTEENILLGIDFTNKDCKSCSVGMVLPLWSDAKIHLDGDGGFTVNTANRTHVFKPVSVQAMWSALQVLHKACEVSRRFNYFPGGMALTWMGYYDSCISSDQSCINEWNVMKDLETTRPDSPVMFVDKPTERERTECLIKSKLRSIMTCQDLENVTCKQIRTELEQHMNCNLKEYKEFIDNEMLLILGQMDKATLIFDHVYLGSEWNASNLEELQETGVGYILNVTREIDNFFPGTFSYHNVRVYDEDSTDLLAYWNDTYNFIVKAKKNHSKCLVHCKMGVSRSASTVIAYAMKEFGWSLEKAYNFVKQKRSITRPNTGFMKQLAEYEGILDASKQRHNKLWQPDLDCEMAEGMPLSVQCCGLNKEDYLTPGSSMSPCCEDSLSDKGAACPPPTVALQINPAYNNYYFRRLSDSALDSEPSTPVRGPSLLGLEKVFIEIEDVERDALLDDEAFDEQEGLPLPHLRTSAECSSAQTCSSGPEPLEELQMRLEFTTVQEEEEVQKEEAEMEVLLQPDGGGGRSEGSNDGNGMDLAAMNENSNNNNCLSTPRNLTDHISSRLTPSEICCESMKKMSHPHTKLCLSWSPSVIPSASFPSPHSASEGLLPPVGQIFSPRCGCANCAAAGALNESENSKSKTKHIAEDLLESLPKLLRIDIQEEMPALACYLGPQQETLVQLRKSGLVRRRAERLERLSGLTQEGLPSLKPLHTCQMSKKTSFYTDEEEEFSHFTGDFAKSSTPCQVHLEPLVMPLPNDAVMGVVGSGLFTPTSSPHGSALTRSSSSESLCSVKGRPGLVRQRAQEIETRMRLAGLTVPSRLKRSNSLAKLRSLNFSSEDLCSGCTSDAGKLLLLSLSPEQDTGHSSAAFTLSTQLSKDFHSPERALAFETLS